jgi:hypothetical protein
MIFFADCLGKLSRNRHKVPRHARCASRDAPRNLAALLRGASMGPEASYGCALTLAASAQSACFI